MSRTAIFLPLLAAMSFASLNGCYFPRARFGPPPPAYACDSYGCDGYDAYGGFGYSECVDGGQYDSRRDFRRQRRDDRRYGDSRRSARRGGPPTYNGLPIVAAYIVPMEMAGDCGCAAWETGGDCFACDDGFPCGECGPGGGMPYEGGYSPCGANGCMIDSGLSPYDSGELVPSPSEAYPYSDPGEGGRLIPMPVPPAADEGPWNPPPQTIRPRSTPEPEAARPAPTTTWLPARL